MNITFYGYNTFVIKHDDKKIAIDPGASFYFPDLFKPLIPKSEWKSITHIFVTHGDPDHHWYTDRVAEVSGAKVICNVKMVRRIEGRLLMLGPRSKGLVFTTPLKNLNTVAVGETIELDGMNITGIIGTHGPLTFRMGPFSRTLHEGTEERFGYGEMGFHFTLDHKILVNLGDTILHEEEWKEMEKPDILMIPIGGKIPGNTMDEIDALKAVQIIQPEWVIPTHYNCGGLFKKCYNPADDQMFKAEVEHMGSKCIILRPGSNILR